MTDISSYMKLKIIIFFVDFFLNSIIISLTANLIERTDCGKIPLKLHSLNLYK